MFSEREGINVVRTLFERHRHLVQETGRSFDEGPSIDILVSLTLNGRRLDNKYLGIQVKNGLTYKRAHDYYIPVDGNSESWRKSPFPIIGIVNDPEEGRMFWVNLTQELREGTSSGRISVSRERELNDDTFRQFLADVREYIEATDGKDFVSVVGDCLFGLATWRFFLLAAMVAVIMNGVVGFPRLSVDPALIIGNTLWTFAFVAFGLGVVETRPVYRSTGWMLILAGVFHPLGWLNWWNFGPFPIYAAVFGTLDDIFLAWALFLPIRQYLNVRILAYLRRTLVLLMVWLIAGSATVVLLSQRSDYTSNSSSFWPPAPFGDHHGLAFDVFEAGIIFIVSVFLVLAWISSRALSVRLIVVAVFAIGLAGTAESIFQMFNPSAINTFDMVEAFVLAIPIVMMLSCINALTKFQPAA